METNTDLHWDLKHIIHQQKAYNYMQQFRDVFCVYSESVCQLYSNYRLHYTDGYGENEIQILPDEQAWHETFDAVRTDAVRPSNIMLFPGELLGKEGFFMRMPVKGDKKWVTLPLSEAFERVLSKKDSFLPLIKKGDLREFKARSPYLHLHWLDLERMSNLSAFQRLDIADTILSRFHEIVR